MTVPTVEARTGEPISCPEVGDSAAGFRANFPMLTRTVHLASCSLGARSSAMDAALAQMLDDMATGGAPWSRFEEQVDQARQRFASLVNARVDQIAVVPNASTGAYQVASTMDWSDRTRLVTTSLEFPSIAHVWLAQRPRGCDVTFAEPWDNYAEAIDTRTRLVSIPIITYHDALRMPVADVVEIAHGAGAQVFIDAYQAAGVDPIDVEQLGCDFLVAGTSKYLLGLPGLAFLYARSPAATDRDPRLTGWFGRVNPFAFDPRGLDFAAGATRFETGTPAVPACYAANAGLGLIGCLDMVAVRGHVASLTSHATESLRAIGESVRTPADPANRGAHIGIVDSSPTDLAAWLADRHVAVSARGDVARVSVHYYNNADDIAALCEAVHSYRSHHGPSSRPDTVTGGGSHVDS